MIIGILALLLAGLYGLYVQLELLRGKFAYATWKVLATLITTATPIGLVLWGHEVIDGLKVVTTDYYPLHLAALVMYTASFFLAFVTERQS